MLHDLPKKCSNKRRWVFWLSYLCQAMHQRVQIILLRKARYIILWLMSTSRIDPQRITSRKLAENISKLCLRQVCLCVFVFYACAAWWRQWRCGCEGVEILQASWVVVPSVPGDSEIPRHSEMHKNCWLVVWLPCFIFPFFPIYWE